MEAVKQWAFAVCATMLVSGLAHMLLPKSNMEKTFRMVVSIFFLCALLSPVILHSPKIVLDIPTVAQAQVETRGRRVEEIADRQAVELAEKNIGQIVASNLSQRGIKVYAVTINITTDDQNVPRLEDAELILDEEHQEDHSRLTAELEQDLGCMVRIGYRSPGGG